MRLFLHFLFVTLLNVILYFILIFLISIDLENKKLVKITLGPSWI